MDNRFKANERLMAATRERIPAAAVAWLAAVRKPLEALTMAALSGDVSDAEFQAMVGAFSESLPGLLEEMDHAAIADLMERSMGAGMANGFAARYKTQDNKTQEKKAKLPWETDVWLAGRGKGKRCGNSWIASWKQCGPDDGREWDPVSAEEAAALSRMTGKGFKEGARILATPEGIRHAEKGHKHQISENDWKNLRGRLFDNGTDRSLSDTGRDGQAVQFNFLRGKDPMEAVFTMHHSHRKSLGELRLKTYKMLTPQDLARRKS